MVLTPTLADIFLRVHTEAHFLVQEILRHMSIPWNFRVGVQVLLTKRKIRSPLNHSESKLFHFERHKPLWMPSPLRLGNPLGVLSLALFDPFTFDNFATELLAFFHRSELVPTPTPDRMSTYSVTSLFLDTFERWILNKLNNGGRFFFALVQPSKPHMVIAITACPCKVAQ